jgi:hypothetical protein
MQDACEICVKLVKKLVANTLPLLAHFRAKAAALLLLQLRICSLRAIKSSYVSLIISE